MKVNGQPVTPPADEMLVLERDGAKFLVFKIRALKDMDEFNKLCPEPDVPGVFDKHGNFEPDPENKDYKTIMAGYQMRRLSYMVIKSLEPSNIEWDLVDINKPKTWNLWQEDMKNAGMTSPEVNAIFNLVLETNTLSEAKMQKARDAFLRGQAQASEDTSGQPTEPESTPSGAHAPE